jgi:tetratricopeptide (TPR) repeat protein
VEAARESADWAAQARDPLAEAQAYHRQGRAWWQAGQYHQARPLLEKSLSLAERSRSRADQAACLYDLSVLDYYEGAYDQGLSRLEVATQIYESLNDRHGEIRCLGLQATLLDGLGRHEEARHLFERTLLLCRQVGWRYAEARTLIQSADNLLLLADFEASRRQLEQAIATCVDIGDLEAEASSRDTLGVVHLYMDEPQVAVAHLEKALVAHEELQNQRGLGYTLTHLGYALAQRAEWPSASQALQRALGIRREMAAGGLLVDTLAGLAWVALAQGDLEGASAHVSEVLAYIAEYDIAGIEFPIQVHLISYQVLGALDPSNPTYQSQAEDALLAGRILLQDRAARIEDDALRERFLQRIPHHRQIEEAWLQLERRQE